MNINQGLKQKNQLVNEIKQNFEILQKFNSIDENNTRRYSMVDTLSKIETLTDQLVTLKTKIHIANAPVYDKIFKLSELKNNLNLLKLVPTTEGSHLETYSSVVTTKKVEINILDLNHKIQSYQSLIDKIQDELDVHNANTLI